MAMIESLHRDHREAPKALHADGLVRVGLLVFAVTWGLELLAARGLPVPGALLSGLVLLYPALAALALGRGIGSLPQPQERRFWRLLTLASLAWLCIEILHLLPDLFAGNASLVFLRQLLFASVYLCWILAIEDKPHRPPGRSLTGLERILTWPAVTLFVFGLLVYFLVIPAQNFETYLRLEVRFYFFAILDGYLVGRLLFLARSVRTGDHWHTLYYFLAWPSATFLTIDLIHLAAPHLPALATIARDSVAWRGLAFVLLMIAAQLRYQPLRRAHSSLPVPHQSPDHTFARSVQTLLFGLAFPVFHFLLYSLEWLDPAQRETHEKLVALALLVFGIAAWLQHHLLQRHARQLWVQRQSFKEQLRSSEQDLRLIVTRNEAAEAQRASQKKFDLAVNACPYPVALNRFEDGRFVDVNPAFVRALGFRHDEIVGRTATELRLWGSRELARAFYAKLEEGELIREMVTVLREKDGHLMEVLFSAEVMELEGQAVLLSVWREVPPDPDATGAVPAAAALVRGARAAVLLLDENCVVRDWNPGAEKLFGWKADDTIGLPVAQTLAQGAQGWDEALAKLRRDQTWSGEMELLSRDGKTLHVEGWGGMVSVEQGAGDHLLILAPQGADRT